eukprot:15463524-Alexandrium_andersonii.AAC.1
MSKNKERWATRDQLVKHYHSEVVADAVIAGLSADEKRPNPAAPKCVEANQFYAASLTYAFRPTHKLHSSSWCSDRARGKCHMRFREFAIPWQIL